MKKKSPALEQLAELRSKVIGTERAKTRKILAAKPGEVADEAASQPVPAGTTPEPAATPEVPAASPAANEPATALETREQGVAALPLPNDARRRLEHHATDNQWTPAAILQELVRAHLHGAYPAITYRTAPIADAGVFCSYDRVACAPHLLLKTGRGKYLIQARPENPEHAKWLAVYQKRNDPRAGEKASAMCVFSLQQQLETYDGPHTVHVIYPEDFLVEHVV